MSKRARFETDKGLVILSRNTLTVASETGETVSYATEGKVNRVTKPGDTLTVTLLGGGVMSFKVTKTPSQLREAGLKAFAPKEFSRLQKLGDEQATEAFSKRYSKYLPR